MTTTIDGALKEDTYIISAVDGHTFVVDTSNPFSATISRFNKENAATSSGTVSSYGCTLSGRTVTFSVTPVTGGTAILTVRGRL